MEKNIIGKDRISNPNWKVGDEITFFCGNTQKKGVVLIVDSNGTFENPGIPSYDILVEEENMLYKYVSSNMMDVKLNKRYNAMQKQKQK